MEQIRKTAADEMVQSTVAGDTAAARAVGFAQTYRTPMTPEVYAVWYTYCQRENKAVNEALDLAMNANQPITPGMLSALYHDHVSPRSIHDQMSDVTNQVIGTLDGVSNVMEQNIKDNTAYSGKLKSAKQSLSFGTSKAEVSAVIATLHKANQEHITIAQKATQQLEKSRSQVSKLKHELIEARKASQTDYLTGLANRRQLDSFMDTAIFEARQKGQKLFFLMGAIDRITDVTARFGLATGDNVMRALGDDLKKLLREPQMAARFEGTRFAILLPNTHDREAYAIGDRVRKAFHGRDWVSGGTGVEIGKLTTSFGGCSLQEGESRDELILRADQLLSETQAKGPDQIVID